MVLLIDAYNVLKQVMPSEKIGDRERARFIEELGRYARLRGHKVVLVFDGGPYDRAFQERVAGVYVVYAGWQESADDYMKRYLDEHRELDMVLVSSDREVRAAAHRFHIESIPAPDFYSVMRLALQEELSFKGKETEVVKISESDNEELDALMRAGSFAVQTKAEDALERIGSRESKAHRASKRDRKTIKKIRKL